MNKKQFTDKYCTKCGTQRCEGVDSEWVDGCGHWKREMSGLNLVEKAMDNKGIGDIIDDVSITNAIFPWFIKNDNFIEKLANEIPYSFNVGYIRHKAILNIIFLNKFESMNEEVEC